MGEKIEDHAAVRIHPPVLTFLHLLAAFLMDWLLPLPKVLPQALLWFGVVLVFVGLTLGFLAVREFTQAHTTLDPHGSVTQIVTGGPYRFSRNPIYLGFVCLLIGLPLVLGKSYWGAVLSPLLILSLNQLVIWHEEAYLEKKFGEVYTNYKSRVRRWL